MSTFPTPSQDDKEGLLLSCRYGDLEETQEYLKKFGPASLADVRDDNGNTVVHMVSGNGHLDVLDLILPTVPSQLLSAQNDAQSTALHWAALNQHLSIIKKLVQFPGGPGVDLIDIKNSSGRSPLGEAEMAGWDEGAKWFVENMKLDTDGVKEDDSSEAIGGTQEVEVEIEDADGKVAKMTISGDGDTPKTSKSTSAS